MTDPLSVTHPVGDCISEGMGIVRLFFAILALFALHAAARAEGPPLHGETLDKQKVDLRMKAKGQGAAVLFGFSKDAQTALKAWTERLQKELGTGGATRVYNVASLQAAPFFVRGMIKSGMRGDVPEGFHSHFLVITNRNFSPAL